MNSIITCTVKQAKELMKHLDENDMVTLTVINQKNCIHYGEPMRIEKRCGDNLLEKAEVIEYQNNDFFGRFSLFGTKKNKDIVQNILFPQLE